MSYGIVRSEQHCNQVGSSGLLEILKSFWQTVTTVFVIQNQVTSRSLDHTQVGHWVSKTTSSYNAGSRVEYLHNLLVTLPKSPTWYVMYIHKFTQYSRDLGNYNFCSLKKSTKNYTSFLPQKLYSIHTVIQETFKITYIR